MSFEGLRRRADLGHLKPDDLVRRDKQTRWVPARSIEGLIQDVEKELETFYLKGASSGPLAGCVLIVIATSVAACLKLHFGDNLPGKWLCFGWLPLFLIGLCSTEQITITLCETQYGRRIVKRTRHFLFLAWSAKRTDLKQFRSINIGGAASGTTGPLSGVIGSVVLAAIVMGTGGMFAASRVSSRVAGSSGESNAFGTLLVVVFAALPVLALFGSLASKMLNRDTSDDSSGRLSVRLLDVQKSPLLVYSGKDPDELRRVANRLEKLTGLRSRNVQ